MLRRDTECLTFILVCEATAYALAFSECPTNIPAQPRLCTRKEKPRRALVLPTQCATTPEQNSPPKIKKQLQNASFTNSHPLNMLQVQK